MEESTEAMFYRSHDKIRAKKKLQLAISHTIHSLMLVENRFLFVFFFLDYDDAKIVWAGTDPGAKTDTVRKERMGKKSQGIFVNRLQA